MKAKHFIALVSTAFLSISAQAYELRQVSTKHVQVGGGAILYISVAANTAAPSGCSMHNGWLRMDLSDSNVAGITREIISFALAAYRAGTPVDVGSEVDGCVNGYANLSFIRVGNYE